MADSIRKSDDINQKQEQQRLKYLDFIHVAASQAVMCLASLYEFAKENAGPLKPGVDTVEGTVKSVVGPVYEKFHDVPFEILKFVDRKVDEMTGELEKHMPSLVKQASTQAYTTAQKVPEVARFVAGEVQRAGVVGTTTGMAKDLYAQYEPVGEQYAVAAWQSLNRLPLFPQVAQIVVSTAAYWSEKYNRAVGVAAEQGYSVVDYLPLVPTERIAKMFGCNEDGTKEVVVE